MTLGHLQILHLTELVAGAVVLMAVAHQIGEMAVVVVLMAVRRLTVEVRPCLVV